ncbi:hypothetical protein VYU27_001605 [Nannochloropsis oceanica]
MLSASSPVSPAGRADNTFPGSKTPLHSKSWGSGASRSCRSTTSTHHQGTGSSLAPFKDAKACFEAERAPLLKDIEGLRRMLQQKDTDHTRQVARAVEMEQALRSQVQLYKSKLEKALAGKKQMEVVVGKQKYGQACSCGGKDDARVKRWHQEREASEQEKEVLRSSISSLEMRCVKLEEEKAEMEKEAQECLDRAGREIEELRAREEELKQWLETTGLERAAMVELLRNGSQQCRAVLAAAELGGRGEGEGSRTTTAGSGVGAGRSLVTVAQRRVHLEKVKSLQKEFVEMLGRLEEIPCLAEDAPSMPERFCRDEKKEQQQQQGQRARRFAEEEEEDEEDEEEVKEGKRMLKERSAKYEAFQREKSALQAELAQLKGGPTTKKEQQQQQQQFPSQAELLERDNRLMHDRLEGVLSGALSRSLRAEQGGEEDQEEDRGGVGGGDEGGGRLPVLEEAEKLLTQAASRFYALATRLQEKEEEEEEEKEKEKEGAGTGREGRREGGSGLVPMVQAFGRELAHLRRLLTASEHLALNHQEERECIAFFFEEAFGVEGGLPPLTKPGRSTSSSLPSSLHALQNMLVACQEVVEGWKARPLPPSGPPSPSKKERQLQERLTALRKAVEIIVPPSSPPLPSDLLALAVKEKWLGICKAAGEGRRLQKEKNQLAAAVEKMKEETKATFGELKAMSEARDKQLVGEVSALREAVMVALVEMGAERPSLSSSSSSKASSPSSSSFSSSSSSSTSKQLAHALMQALSASKARLMEENKRLRQQDEDEEKDKEQGGHARERQTQETTMTTTATSFTLVQLLEEIYHSAHATRQHSYILQMRVAEMEARREEKEEELQRLVGQMEGLSRIEEAVGEVVEELWHHPQVGLLLAGNGNSIKNNSSSSNGLMKRKQRGKKRGGKKEGAEDMAARLRHVVMVLTRELDGRGKDLERIWGEAMANEGTHQAAMEEVEQEVRLLRKVLQVYEEALYGALTFPSPFVEEEEGGKIEGTEKAKKKKTMQGSRSGVSVSGVGGAHAAVVKGNDLARRLKEHVEGLRAQVEEKMEECCEIEEARGVERREIWEEMVRWKEKAGLYLRLLTSLEEAARSVVLVGVGERGKTAAEDDKHKLNNQKKRAEGADEAMSAISPLGLEVALELEQGRGMESIRALCVRLLEYGALARGARGEARQEVGRLEELLAVKEKEGRRLRETLKRQSVELVGLREKVRASYDEVTVWKERLIGQEADVSTLVSSLSRVSEKLTHLRSQGGGIIPEGNEWGGEVDESGDGSDVLERSDWKRLRASQLQGEEADEQSQQQQQQYDREHQQRMRQLHEEQKQEVCRLQTMAEEQAKTIEALAARNALLEEEGQEGWPEEFEHIKSAKKAVEQELHILRRGLAAREKEWAATLNAVNKERERLQRKCGKQEQAVQALAEQLDQSRGGSNVGVLHVRGEEREEKMEAEDGM